MKSCNNCVYQDYCDMSENNICEGYKKDGE